MEEKSKKNSGIIKLEENKEKTKQDLIIVGFLICFIIISILVVYTHINTKSLNNIIEKVDRLEENVETSNYSSQEEKSKKEEQTIEEPQETSGYSTKSFKAIKPSQIASESKKEIIVVLWARQSCGYCQLYAPIITKVAKKHDVKIRYIDMETLYDLSNGTLKNEKEYNILANLEGEGEYENFAAQAIEGTPATYFIKNGKVINGILGYVEEDTVEAVFEEVGL